MQHNKTQLCDKGNLEQLRINIYTVTIKTTPFEKQIKCIILACGTNYEMN